MNAKLDGSLQCFFTARDCAEQAQNLFKQLVKDYPPGIEVVFKPRDGEEVKDVPTYLDFLNNGDGTWLEYVFVWVQRKREWFYVNLNWDEEFWKQVLIDAVLGDEPKPRYLPPDVYVSPEELFAKERQEQWADIRADEAEANLDNWGGAASG